MEIYIRPINITDITNNVINAYRYLFHRTIINFVEIK